MWHQLLHLAAHALKGYLEHRATQHHALPAVPDYSFEQHVRHLAGQTGVPLVALKPGRATFEPRFKGRSFITVLLNQASNISVGMFSNIRFPVGRVPAAVRSWLSGFDSGSGFELDTIDCPDGTFVIGQVSGPASMLTPLAFEKTLDEMMLRLALIDEWIIEQDYA